MEMTENTIKLFGKTIPLGRREFSASAVATSSHGDDPIDMNKCAGGTEEGTNKRTLEHAAKSNNSKEGDPQAGHSELKKRVLACPRCKSKDTKFCYYNNYNINQPRHFCKSCQRYWTEGGTMRNVPVGSGRRKSKSFPSPSTHHYHHHHLDSSTTEDLFSSIITDSHFNSSKNNIGRHRANEIFLNFSTTTPSKHGAYSFSHPRWPFH